MVHSSPIMCVDNHSAEHTFAVGAEGEIIIWSYCGKGNYMFFCAASFIEIRAGPVWEKLKTLPSPFTGGRANTDVLVTSLCWGASRRDLVATYKMHGVV